MLAADPKLKAEFEQRVASDAKFAASPEERLNWFLQRSPWWDRRIGLYPVGKARFAPGTAAAQGSGEERSRPRS